MTEQEIINYWKNNKRGFMFAPKEAQEWLREHSDDNGVLVLEMSGAWIKAILSFTASSIYRIPADYKPEKRGRWVECGVTKREYDYAFEHNGWHNLYVAPGMVGFGGVQYGGKDWWPQPCLIMGLVDGVEKPMPPTRVRFWVGE